MTMTDILFGESTENSSEGQLSFDEFLAIIMRLQNSHLAKVTDIHELREYQKIRLDRVMEALKQGQQETRKQLQQGQENLSKIMSTTGLLNSEAVENRRVISLQLTLDLQGMVEKDDMSIVRPEKKETLTQLRSSAMCIQDVLEPMSNQHGRLVARTFDGIEIGNELMLGELTKSDSLKIVVVPHQQY